MELLTGFTGDAPADKELLPVEYSRGHRAVVATLQMHPVQVRRQAMDAGDCGFHIWPPAKPQPLRTPT
jgi:hypothetical protein